VTLRPLFLGGVPRAATTGVAELLDLDERFAITIERFKYLRGRIDPFFLTPAVLTTPTPAETNVMHREELYDDLRERLARACVVYAGDAHQSYGRELDALAGRFPDLRVLLCYRPANDGEEEAVDEVVAGWAAFDAAGGGDRFFVVVPELLLGGDEGHLRALYGFLELEPSDTVAERIGELGRRQARRRGSGDHALSFPATDSGRWLRDRLKGQADGGP